jgi:SET domain-containing protein
MNNFIEVRRVGDSMGVFATSPIASGETILLLKGLLSEKRSKYSIQVEKDLHLEVPDNTLTIFTGEYQWKFLNHSCHPNSFVDVIHKKLVALKDIAVNEEVTFNYNCTEYELASPFECVCNNKNVMVRGYKYATQEEKENIAPYVAPFLQEE